MFDWDEKKRKITLEDRQLDFAKANFVFESPTKMTIESHRYGESRWKDIAEADGVVFVLIYTYRGGKVRIMSFRPASRKERMLYYGSLL